VFRLVSQSVVPEVGMGGTLLATSLYDDPAAELHEGVSARLRAHLAVPGGSILRRSFPSDRRGGEQDPANGQLTVVPAGSSVSASG